MFSQLHYDYLAFLCWALLLATAAGSVISLAVLILHRVFKQKVVRYSLFLICQLSFIPLLVLTLVFAKPFTALKIDFLEVKDSIAAVDSPPLSQEITIEIAQSALANSSAGATFSKEGIQQELPIKEVKAVSAVPEKSPLLIREKLREITQKYAPIFATFWLIGILVLTLRLVIAAIGLSRLKKYGVEVSPELTSIFHAVKKGVYKKQVILLESAKVATPMVISWVKPVILLPMGIMSKLPTDQVEALLLHELHHIRRHDFLWNILQRVVETLFFFNPLIWILGREIRQLREELCDQSVIEQTNAPAPYAQALMSLAESSDHTLALAAKSKGGALTRRFRSILSPQQLTSPISKMNSVVELCIILLVSVCCFLPVVADLNEDLQAESLPAFVEHTAPSGRILDQEGNPVAGARVILHYDKPDLGEGTNTIVEETVSAADGTYQFKSKLKFTRMGTTDWEHFYAVFATHKDWAIGWYYLRPPNIFGDTSNPNPSTLDLYLEKPVSQDFEVKLFGKKDADGNELEPTPLKGAKVYVYRLSPHKKKPSFLPENYDPSSFYILGGDLGLSAGITDENGKVTLTNLPSSKVGFQIVHPDTSISWKTRAHDRKKDWVTKCFPKTGISGVLEDEKGNPIPNTIIHATSPETRPGWYAKTDAKGRYQFPALYGKGHNANRGGGGKAEFSFKLHESEWMMTETYACTLNSEEDITGLKLTATKGIPFHVTVMQKDGKPHPYAPVSIRNEANSDRKFTDSKGRVTFRVLPGDLNCEVYPNADSYWTRAHYGLNKNDFYERYIDDSLSSLKRSFVVDAKPMKKIKGYVHSPDKEKTFDGVVRLYPILNDRVKIITHRSRLKSISAKVINTDILSFEANSAPSEFSYLAVARSKDLKWVGSTIIHSDNQKPVIKLEATTRQKIVLYDHGDEPFKNKEISWGEYHQGQKVVFSKRKTNGKGELTLPGVRSGKSYYVQNYSSGIKVFKKFQPVEGKSIKLTFNETTQVPVVDQNNQPLEIDEIVQISYQKDWRAYMSYVDLAKVESDSGKLEISGNYLSEWSVYPQMKINGIFKTVSGEVIECVASSQSPVVFRVKSNRTHEFSRPRISKIEKSDLDKKNTFRALIVNQQGEPIQGANSFNFYGKLEDHLYNKYSSVEEFNALREKGKQSFRYSPTKEDGVFYIDPYYGGWSGLRIDAPGYASRWITHERLRENPLKIKFINDTFCQGQLLTSSGDPAVNHPIAFVTSRSYFEEGQRFPIITSPPFKVLGLTDKQGRFKVPLEPGKWVMQASLSNEYIINQEFMLKEGEKLVLQPEITPAAQLKVNFKDQEDNTAIPNIGMSLVSVDSRSEQPLSPIAKVSNKDGSVTFGGLIPGAFKMKINIGYDAYKEKLMPSGLNYSAAFFADQPMSVRNSGALSYLELNLSAGKNEQTMDLAKGTLIEGTLTTSLTGKIPYVVVGYIGNGRARSHDEIRVSKDGTFGGYLPKLDDKLIRIMAYHASNSENKVLAPAFSEGFIVKKGKGYTFELHLTPGGIVKGQFIDGKGKPISDVQVGYSHLGGKTENTGIAWTRTDNEGNFTMKGIAPGKIKLTAKKESKSLLKGLDEQDAVMVKEGETLDLGVVETE